MTDKQLRIFLLNYARQLADAIDELKREHPELSEARKNAFTGGVSQHWPTFENLEWLRDAMNADANSLTEPD